MEIAVIDTVALAGGKGGFENGPEVMRGQDRVRQGGLRLLDTSVIRQVVSAYIDRIGGAKRFLSVPNRASFPKRDFRARNNVTTQLLDSAYSGQSNIDQYHVKNAV